MSRKIEVQILGDSKSLEAALGRAQTKTSKFGSALAVGAKVGAGALIGLGLAAKVGFDELNDSQKVAAQTGAVLKSTGNAANVTAKHVNDLSQALLAKSGVDDEVIASGENVLLTFRNIRNEAGKGNDIFDQATKATLDLSVALGTDMKSASIQVGKALNDPVKGLTALKRVGVQFSDSQTTLIQHLVDTGHKMKAQKIILGELHAEFGGSAAAAGKTLSGQLGILRESFADVSANVVTALLPALQSLLGVITSVTGWMKRNAEATKIIVGVIAALAVGVIAVNAVYKVWSSVTKVVAAAQWLLNAALAANPVVLITVGIIALGVALVVAYKKSQTFRNVVNSAFHAVQSVAGAVIGFIREHWKALLALLPGIGVVLVVVITHFHTLRNAAGAVLGFVHDKFQTVINAAKSLWSWVQSVIDALSGLIKKIGEIPSLPSLPSSIGGVHVPGLSGGLLNNAQVFGGGSSGVASARPIHVHVMLDRREIGSAVVGFDKDYRRQNGRSAFA